MAYAHTPRPPQMPPGFTWHVLDHDAGENDHLRVNIVKNLSVGEIESVSDVGRDPSLERQDDQQQGSVLERK